MAWKEVSDLNGVGRDLPKEDQEDRGQIMLERE
jgi:hypothetical protein